MAKKTLKLKRPGASQEMPLPQDDPIEGAEENDSPVMASVMAPGAVSRSGRSVSYVASGVAGIIAVLLLGALLLLQFMENAEYKGAIPTQDFVALPTAP